MLNVLLLGNGFDLNLNLPTSYLNFLHTVEFIRKNKLTNFKTIGDIWGRPYFEERDPKIKESYQSYKEIYDIIELPSGFVRDIGLRAEKNIWFRYLVDVCNHDIGWIDFEKEISFVVQCFRDVLNKSKSDAIVNDVGGACSEYYTVFSFNFFTLGGSNEKHSVMKGNYPVCADYLFEFPMGSGYKVINKAKIITELYQSLHELAELLQRYLSVFVDETIEKLVERQLITRQAYFAYEEQVITLNYTHSFERLYPSIPVLHLHGETNDKIVLGINTDKFDNGELTSTEYITFKKYYQRIVYGTDSAYLALIANLKENATKISLTVMGHSLDVSDRDIIVELFALASDITVIYHSQQALGDYVANLVKLFGKVGLDELRSRKSLEFVKLSDLDNHAIDLGFESLMDAIK